MREVLVTREDVLMAMEASDNGEFLTESCAMHQALEPFITKYFRVTDNMVTIVTNGKHSRYTFTPALPQELYRGNFKLALSHIEANGPYKFQVEGI